MRFFLGKSLILREYSPSRVSLFLLISSASIGGIIQLVVQITSMYTILMGYCMAGQVRTMMSSAMYKNKLIMGEKSLGGSPWCLLRFFLSDHLRNTRSIALLGSGRVRVNGLGGALWQFWYSPLPCPGPNCFHGSWCWIGIWRLVHHCGPWCPEVRPWIP